MSDTATDLTNELQQSYLDWATSIRPGDLRLHPLPQGPAQGSVQGPAENFLDRYGLLLVAAGGVLAALLLRGRR